MLYLPNDVLPRADGHLTTLFRRKHSALFDAARRTAGRQTALAGIFWGLDIATLALEA